MYFSLEMKTNVTIPKLIFQLVKGRIKSSLTPLYHSDGKESACNVGDLSLIPGSGRPPGGGHGNPLQYSCLENPHGQRSLAGYSLWGCKESDMTKWLRTAQHILLMGFPGVTSGKEPACQCRRHKRHEFNPWVRKIPWRRAWQPTSIFKNLMDRGAWQATVYRLTKSWTRLKRRSSAHSTGGNRICRHLSMPREMSLLAAEEKIKSFWLFLFSMYTWDTQGD